MTSTFLALTASANLPASLVIGPALMKARARGPIGRAGTSHSTGRS
jgi:hypothetical protein